MYYCYPNWEGSFNYSFQGNPWENITLSFFFTNFSFSELNCALIWYRG